MNLYKVISEWLVNNYTPLNNWIYFNSTPDIIGSATLNSVPGDRVINKFIDGSKRKEIIFAIDMIAPYDLGTSSVNMDAFDEVNNFIEWLDAIPKENYPNFGEYNKIEEFIVLSNAPSMLINTTDMMAKYQFQCRIRYKDESEVIR